MGERLREAQQPLQRYVLAKRHQMHLVVAGRDLALRIDESGGVVHQVLAAGGRAHSDERRPQQSHLSAGQSPKLSRRIGHRSGKTGPATPARQPGPPSRSPAESVLISSSDWSRSLYSADLPAFADRNILLHQKRMVIGRKAVEFDVLGELQENGGHQSGRQHDPPARGTHQESCRERGVHQRDFKRQPIDPGQGGDARKRGVGDLRGSQQIPREPDQISSEQLDRDPQERAPKTGRGGYNRRESARPRQPARRKPPRAVRYTGKTTAAIRRRRLRSALRNDA